MLGYVAIGVGAAMAGRLFWMVDDWGRDWTTNHARLSMTNSDPALQPIEVDASSAAVEDMIRKWVDHQSGWAVMSQTENEQHESKQDERADSESSMRRMHLTRTTPVFRFVDDIHLELTPITSDSPDSPRTRIDAESRSRVGKGDLGQNPRNLKALRAGVIEQTKKSVE